MILERMAPAALGSLLLLAGDVCAQAAEKRGQILVNVAPMVNVCQRPGITGAGWAVAFDAREGDKTVRRVSHIYPNHPDDWGKTAGTGLACSSDAGLTWTAGPDNSPLPGMLDMWQDLLPGGELLTFGLRFVPDRHKIAQTGSDPPNVSPYALGLSTDQGKTWRTEPAEIRIPGDVGVLARPLPRIFQNPDGTLFMPAFSWRSKEGSRSLLLKSSDRGRTWDVAATIATGQAMAACDPPLPRPWVETAVARTSDGSLLAVIRTGSSARSPLVTARSTDNGRTWSPVEKLLVGPERRIVPGKLPGLCLLPNGVLVLLTAHSRDHCRIYISEDGTGRQWSDGFVITSQSGGNTSLVGTGADKLLVFTPATGRIACWHVSIARADASVSQGTAAGPANVRAVGSAASVRLSWDAPADAAKVDHYLVTPILVRPAEGNTETEVYPYAPVRTPNGATQLDLAGVVSIGATYRFQVSAVDREGRRSAAASSAEVVVGGKAPSQSPL